MQIVQLTGSPHISVIYVRISCMHIERLMRNNYIEITLQTQNYAYNIIYYL